MTIHCSRQWWSPQESIYGAANFLLFFSLSGSTIYHFITAIYEGPGFLPLKWMPVGSKSLGNRLLPQSSLLKLEYTCRRNWRILSICNSVEYARATRRRDLITAANVMNYSFLIISHTVQVLTYSEQHEN